MGRALSRPLRVSGKLKSNLPQLYKNAHLRHIVTHENGSTEWPRQGYPHLRLEIISGRNGPCPASRKPSPESSVPGENLNRGSRRNQLRRGHGSPPVLGEVPHELSTVAYSKECKRSPQQSIPAGFPLTTTSTRGWKTQLVPSLHRTWSVLDASSQPQLNLPSIYSFTLFTYASISSSSG